MCIIRERVLKQSARSGARFNVVSNQLEGREQTRNPPPQLKIPLVENEGQTWSGWTGAATQK